MASCLTLEAGVNGGGSPLASVFADKTPKASRSDKHTACQHLPLRPARSNESKNHWSDNPQSVFRMRIDPRAKHDAQHAERPACNVPIAPWAVGRMNAALTEADASGEYVTIEREGDVSFEISDLNDHTGHSRAFCFYKAVLRSGSLMMWDRRKCLCKRRITRMGFREVQIFMI
jgi:hypothetical protein